MKIKVYLSIALRIFIIGLIGTLMTFIPDNLRDFFGDKPFVPYESGGAFSYTIKGTGEIDTQWYWGIRHYWYFWTMFLLFILSLISCWMSIARILVKEYKIRL